MLLTLLLRASTNESVTLLIFESTKQWLIRKYTLIMIIESTGNESLNGLTTK